MEKINIYFFKTYEDINKITILAVERTNGLSTHKSH